MEVHVEDKAAEGEEEPAKASANLPKSPPTMPTDAPIPEVQTPGSGSGTKVDDSDVLITGSRQGPIPDPSVLVRSTPDLKPNTTTKGKETTPITTLPTLSSMSTQALYEEYFHALLNTSSWNLTWWSICRNVTRYTLLFTALYTLAQVISY